MTYGASEAFRRLIIQFRTGEVDLEYLSEDISDMTSDPDIRKAIAKAILSHLNEIQNFTFSTIRTMTPDERDSLRDLVAPLVEFYLDEEYFVDELVVTLAQQHERERIRSERRRESLRTPPENPCSKEGELKYEQFFKVFFCEECG